MEEKKQRGRPRKIVTEPIIVEKKQRGRKPKSEKKIIILSDDEEDTVNEEEEYEPPIETYILHLPGIKSSDLNEPHNDQQNTSLSYSELINNDTSLIITKPDISPIFELPDISPYANSTYDDLGEQEEDIDLNGNKIIKKNIRTLLYEFGNPINGEWPTKTSVRCWWDTFPFDTMPCAIPEYYKNNIFYVTGCFCSFNCAAAYIKDRLHSDTDSLYSKLQLLQLLYKKLYETDNKIELAPPWQILRAYGGYLNIEDFRSRNNTNDYTYNIIKPPMVSIITKIEENVNIRNKNIFIPLKEEGPLRIKRNKPLINPNKTLAAFFK